jgi:hypothetical protein
MVSKQLNDLNPTWKIWHPFDDPDCFGSDDIRKFLLDASDHFPVTLDIPD